MIIFGNMNRRIAIYLGSRTPITKIELNHSYSSKWSRIVGRTGEKKAALARVMLASFFGTDDNQELAERINYAAENVKLVKCKGDNKKGMASRISRVCQSALRKCIDSHPALKETNFVGIND